MPSCSQIPTNKGIRLVDGRRFLGVSGKTAFLPLSILVVNNPPGNAIAAFYEADYVIEILPKRVDNSDYHVIDEYHVSALHKESHLIEKSQSWNYLQ